MQTRSFLLTLFIAILVFSSKAQDKVITGMVTTFDSLPLIGAEVKVVSTKETIQTDTLGRFIVKVNSEDKLKVTAKGFFTQTVKLDEKTKMALINLKLRPTQKSREYAIGYGYVKDGEKLNALAQLTEDDVNFSQYTSMYDLIRGRFAGVTIDNSGDIIIRGINSINLSSGALIVVDGIAQDKSVLQLISPINVKSINIIKDGSAAIYGSRGGNGVVIIETKGANN